MSLLELQQRVLELSREEQLMLRSFIDETTHPTSPEFDEHWLGVVKRRQENLRDGKSRSVGLEDVLSEFEPGV